MGKILLLASAIRVKSVTGVILGEEFGLPHDPKADATLGAGFQGAGFAWLLNNIANALLTLVASASVLFLIIGSIQYVLAAGNDDLSEKGKKSITWAIRGLAISVFAWTIVNGLIFSSPLNPGYTY